MLDYANHTTTLQPIEDGTAESGNPHRFATQRTITDDIVGIRLADIE